MFARSCHIDESLDETAGTVKPLPLYLAMLLGKKQTAIKPAASLRASSRSFTVDEAIGAVGVTDGYAHALSARPSDAGSDFGSESVIRRDNERLALDLDMHVGLSSREAAAAATPLAIMRPRDNFSAPSDTFDWDNFDADDVEAVGGDFWEEAAAAPQSSFARFIGPSAEARTAVLQRPATTSFLDWDFADAEYQTTC